MTTPEALIERLEDAATKCMTAAYEAGKVASKPGIHMGEVNAAGEMAQAIVAVARHLGLSRPGPATPKKIDYRAECWPESPHAKAQQAEAVAAVPLETLAAWKSMVNSLAVMSLKTERTRTAIALKTLIQDEINAATNA